MRIVKTSHIVFTFIPKLLINLVANSQQGHKQLGVKKRELQPTRSAQKYKLFSPQRHGRGEGS